MSEPATSRGGRHEEALLAFAAALLVTAGFAAPRRLKTIRNARSASSSHSGRAAAPISSAAFWPTRCKASSASRSIVENKPGAGGILGNDVVAKATPDGYTLGIMTAGQIIAAVTKKNMPYDTNTAFAPVGQVATASLMIVTRPDFPASNVKELVAYAKDHPGKVVFASPGFAATQHFAGEMFKQIAKVDLLHVPYTNRRRKPSTPCSASTPTFCSTRCRR